MEYEQRLLGVHGFKAVTSGALGAGDYAALKALGGDLTINATAKAGAGDDLAGVVLQQGDALVGSFSDAEIASGTGTLLGYHARRQEG